MAILERLDLDRLTPGRLWAVLEPEARAAAARALYRRDPAGRREADFAIATTMRFRDAAVRQLPVERRARYVAGMPSLSDSLVSSLLLAFHLEERKDVLGAFLDALEIPHEDGLIEEGREIEPPAAGALAAGAEALYASFPEDAVDTYLASLLALDPDTWGGLAPTLDARKKAAAKG